jgi:hypothetical protein
VSDIDMRILTGLGIALLAVLGWYGADAPPSPKCPYCRDSGEITKYVGPNEWPVQEPCSHCGGEP